MSVTRHRDVITPRRAADSALTVSKALMRRESESESESEREETERETGREFIVRRFWPFSQVKHAVCHEDTRHATRDLVSHPLTSLSSMT